MDQASSEHKISHQWNIYHISKYGPNQKTDQTPPATWQGNDHTHLKLMASSYQF